MNNCFHCKKPTKNPKFCSLSCSASVRNSKRVITKESKLKTANSVFIYHKNNSHNKKIKFCPICKGEFSGENKYCSLNCLSISKKKYGPYCVLTKSTCNICNLVFFAKTRLYYCNSHRNDMPNKKAMYRFKFNVYDYPNLFDLDLLNKVGFYAPKGKSGSWNPDGLSRDHKISINEAIKHNYDPYYITHPLNCQLMPHKDNNKKKTKSSITFHKLKNLVDKFDIKNRK